MDVTPLIPEGRQVVESYGGGGFRVSGESYQGSVLVLPEATQPWPVTSIEELSEASLEPLLDSGKVEILLIGCGPKARPVAADLRQRVRARGAVIDVMDTGAACRTYNVLLAEERRVAAALIAVD
jgi:uncharacterized protein